MAYYLSIVNIIHKMNQEDTSEFPKSHTLEMSITNSLPIYLLVISFSEKEIFKLLKAITLPF